MLILFDLITITHLYITLKILSDCLCLDNDVICIYLLLLKCFWQVSFFPEDYVIIYQEGHAKLAFNFKSFEGVLAPNTYDYVTENDLCTVFLIEPFLQAKKGFKGDRSLHYLTPGYPLEIPF